MTPSFLDRFRSQRRQPPVRPVFDGLAQVRAYWEGLRQAGSLPARASLDPRGLEGVLDRVFLAERIGQGLAQVRMAGSGLCDLAGTDLRGLPLSCLFAAEARPLLAQTLERVFSDATLAELDLGADRGKTGITLARLLMLPLADEAGGKLFLGAMGFAADGTAQHKFQVLARREERVTLTRTRTGPADTPHEAPIRQIGHLALVHSST